ncbi:unnamed protein product [Dicrocoelium dendriticum]|nr:unnamed protein product [Dicrocoelium dendriticum]
MSSNVLSVFHFILDAHGIRLSVYSLTTTVERAQVNKLPTCPICLVDFEEGDTIITLPCFHIYHKNCVRPWLHSGDGCAMCRLTPLELLHDADKIIHNGHVDGRFKEQPMKSKPLLIK